MSEHRPDCKATVDRKCGVCDCTPGAMTREQVENHCNMLADANVDWPGRESLSEALLAHDAALRATIAQQAQELAKEREISTWYGQLVKRASIGTTATPSLGAYVEQTEAKLAAREPSLEGSRAEVAALEQQLAAMTTERDAALAEQSVLDAKYVDERAAKDSATDEADQYFKCLQIEKDEHATALCERDKAVAQLAARTYTWTTARPTVAGWYWWRDSKYNDGQPDICRIVNEYCYFASPDDRECDLWSIDSGEWAGPIMRPKEET